MDITLPSEKGAFTPLYFTIYYTGINILINKMRQYAGKHLNTHRHWFQYLKNIFLVITKETHQNMTFANILQANNI